MESTKIDHGSSEFVLRLDGIKLPKEHEARIAGALQKALIAELGDIDLGGHVGLRIPKEWWGIWIERLRDTRIPQIDVNVRR